MKLLAFFWHLFDSFSKFWNKVIVAPMKKSMFKQCGSKVVIGRRVKANGWGNISVGNNVSIGEDCRFMTTIANVYIGDHVMFAPNVTVVTGGHRTDIKDIFMDAIKEEDKRPEDDQDIVFEGDNWIGVNAIILKGVTVGYGAVVAAGAIVTKNVEPYSIVGNKTAIEIKKRFSN